MLSKTPTHLPFLFSTSSKKPPDPLENLSVTPPFFRYSFCYPFFQDPYRFKLRGISSSFNRNGRFRCRRVRIFHSHWAGPECDRGRWVGTTAGRLVAIVSRSPKDGTSTDKPDLLCTPRTSRRSRREERARSPQRLRVSSLV